MVARHRVSFPGTEVPNRQQAILTNTTTVINYIGSSAVSGTGDVSTSRFSVAVTTTGNEIFELNHYTQTATSPAGLGRAASSGNGELYAQVVVQEI